MRCHQDVVAVKTPGQGFSDVTSELRQVVTESGLRTGVCTVFIQHTSASLVVQENADPAVLRDLASWMGELVSRARRWEHSTEGPDDMPAHVRSVLTCTSLSIPIAEGQLALGTWQGVYLWEHRDRPHHRRCVVHVAGTE